MPAPPEVKWDDRAAEEFLNDPDGPVGRDLFARLGDVVLAGADRRALRRTGRMASEMFARTGRDEHGLYTDVVSPVWYARFHEGKKVRDRRPHRSLRPALGDIRRILG